MILAVGRLTHPNLRRALELDPLRDGGGPVFLGGALGAAEIEEGLVVADEVLVDDGYVAAGGLQVGVPEQGGAEGDGQDVC